MNPSDLLPSSWISPTTDWYSFAGNAASIFGFFLGAISLWITILVKRQVKKIEREFVLRLRSRDWLSKLTRNSENLAILAVGTPFQPEETRRELARAAALVKILTDQLPPNLAKEAESVLRRLTEHRAKRWFRTETPVSAAQTSDVSFVLFEFGENLRHVALKHKDTPTR